MNKEKLLYYSNKYKNHQIKLAIIFMIIIILIGLALIGVGIFLAIYESDTYRIIIGSIMGLLGISDIPLGILFYRRVKRNITRLKEEEAVKRYARIYGVKPDSLKDIKK